MDRAIDTAFFPCAHVMACGECAARCDRCPLCRAPIQHSHRIFLPIELQDTDHILQQHHNSSHTKEQFEDCDDDHVHEELQNHSEQLFQVNQPDQQQLQHRNGLSQSQEQITGVNQVGSGADCVLHRLEQVNQTQENSVTGSS
jgi:hypothetical protein